ncbi:MAG TPA: glycoside hydrolase family 88 protein [Polyangiales bacterium]|nr:glycoside hydrolase family 88 protein [Polyangiales bacterium]
MRTRDNGPWTAALLCLAVAGCGAREPALAGHSSEPMGGSGAVPAEAGAHSAGAPAQAVSEAGSAAISGSAGAAITVAGGASPVAGQAGASPMPAAGSSGSVTPAAGSGGSMAAAGSGGAMSMLPSGSLARRFADAVLTRWPNPADIAMNNPAWEYNHGIVLRGIEQVYLRSGDARYLTYIKRFVDAAVRSDGGLDIPAAHSFDNLQPAILLPLLFERTDQAKYKTAAASVRARYDTIPRNAERGFWHKQQYPNQMWLDSSYMGMPFLTRYAKVFGGCDAFCYDTVAEQMLLLAEHLRDSSGLLYHAWDASPRGQKAPWADPNTGRSPAVWGRGLGWYAMALVDVLADLPSTHPQRQRMLDVLTALAAGLATTQDPATGLWFQVVDQSTRSDDWLESSGTGMFVYALKVGVERGYIENTYLAVAQKGFEGLMSKVGMDANGLPVIRGAVQGMGVQNDYAGYIAQMQLSNSPHGLCAILLASSEMEAR